MPLREEIFQEECTMFLLRWQDKILQNFANQDKNRQGSAIRCFAGFFVEASHSAEVARSAGGV
jgi:hypothetical protein